MGHLLSLVERPLVGPIVAGRVVHDAGGDDGGVVFRDVLGRRLQQGHSLGILVEEGPPGAVDLEVLVVVPQLVPHQGEAGVHSQRRLHVARGQDLLGEAPVVDDELGSGLGDGGVEVILVEILLLGWVGFVTPALLLDGSA